MYFGAPVWIQMLNGTFQNRASIPLWKDWVTVGENVVIIIALLTLSRKAEEGTTRPLHTDRESAPLLPAR